MYFTITRITQDNYNNIITYVLIFIFYASTPKDNIYYIFSENKWNWFIQFYKDSFNILETINYLPSLCYN